MTETELIDAVNETAMEEIGLRLRLVQAVATKDDRLVRDLVKMVAQKRKILIDQEVIDRAVHWFTD